MHHFSLGVSSLPFIGFLVTAILTEGAYVVYQHKIMQPRIRSGKFVPEHRLEIGILAGLFIPISLFIFGACSAQRSLSDIDRTALPLTGWTSRPSTHWIAPVIGASIYLCGLFLLFQAILVYM